jgi:hypothetical protein
MNARIASIDSGDFKSPIGLSPSVSQLSHLHEGDSAGDDILFFRGMDSPVHLVAQKPLPVRRHAVLEADSMLIPASVIRRIEQELRDNEYDSRTVFSCCRGLPRGSRRFEEAYIAARIRSFSKHRRQITDPLLNKQSCTENPSAELNPYTMMKALPVPSHPLAVIHLGHLMRHFGIWVLFLLGIQGLAGWRLSALANEYLEGGRFFYLAVALFVMLAVDSAIWFRRRGNLSAAFHIPGAVLFLTALVPVVVLHLRDVLMALK